MGPSLTLIPVNFLYVMIIFIFVALFPPNLSFPSGIELSIPITTVLLFHIHTHKGTDLFSKSVLNSFFSTFFAVVLKEAEQYSLNSKIKVKKG